MKPLVFLIIACSGCVLAITNEKRRHYKEPVDRSFIGAISSWFGGNQHENTRMPIHYHYGQPQPLRPIITHHQSYELPVHQYPAKHPQKYTIIKKVPYQVKVPVPRPVPIKVSVPKPYTVEKKIPVPVKVYVPHPYTVEKKVPYPVKVKVPVPQPYVVERKVPFEVKVPVEKPYIVHVPKPYPVYFEEHAAGGKHSHHGYKAKPIPMHAYYKPQFAQGVKQEATPGEWKLGQDQANNYYFEKKREPTEEWFKHHEVGSFVPSIETVKPSNTIKFKDSSSDTIKFEDDIWANPIDVQHHGFGLEGVHAAEYRSASTPETFHKEQPHKSRDLKLLDVQQHENHSAQFEVHEFEPLPQPLQLVKNDGDQQTNQIHDEDTQVIYGQSDENQGGFKPPTDVFYINPSNDGNVIQSSYNVAGSPSAQLKPIQEYPIYVANINNGKQSVQAGYQVNEETGEPEQNKKPGNYYASYIDSRDPRKLHKDVQMIPPVYYTSNDMVTSGGSSGIYGGHIEMVPSLNRRYDYVERPLVRTRTTPAHVHGKSMRRMDFEPQIWAQPNMAGWTPIETRRGDDGSPPSGDERS